VRYFGVLSSHSKFCSEVVPKPAKDSAAFKPPPASGDQLEIPKLKPQTDDPRPSRKRWAWLLAHVFRADTPPFLAPNWVGFTAYDASLTWFGGCRAPSAGWPALGAAPAYRPGDPPVDHGLEVFAVLGFLPVAGDLVAVLSCDIGPLVMKLGSQASPWPLQALVSFCRSPASELSTYSRRCRSEWKGSH